MSHPLFRRKILEYAVGNVAVAIGWPGYFQGLAGGLALYFLFGLRHSRLRSAPPEPLVAAAVAPAAVQERAAL